MPPDVLPLIRSRANRRYVPSMWPHPFSLGILAPGVTLRWELSRVDVCGRTCGVETKCMLSLHTICSGMHLIKRKESVFRSVSRGCLCFVDNYFSQRHNMLWISLFLGYIHGFPRLLVLCQFSCKCGHTLPLVQTGHGKQGAHFTFYINLVCQEGVIPTRTTWGWNKAPKNDCSCGKKQGEREQEESSAI